MEFVTASIAYLSTIPQGFRWIIMLLVSVLVIKNLLEYERYKWRRKSKTTAIVMGFVESILSNILSDSINNMREIMLEERDGKLTQEDKIELNLCRLAAANSLLIETKHKIKSVIAANGYYKKIKTGEDITELVNQRAKELREISRSNIDNIIRSSSPLQGVGEKRFSMENSEKLFRIIVDKHIKEIDVEVSDIVAFGKKNLWLLYKIMPYYHEEDDLK